MRDASYPRRIAFCVGAVVIILKNYIFEWKIMNGAIGIVCDIVFDNITGQRKQDDAIHVYVVVEFPNYIIPNVNKCFQNQAPRLVPI